MPKKQRIKYINVPLVDVEGMLPFNKRPVEDISDEAKEDERLKKEIGDFMREIQKKMHEPVCYIGEEKKYGKHLERFMFSAEGFVEIMVEAPLTINAHFTHMSMAKRYAKALKGVLAKKLPNSKIKEMFIDSISIDDSEREPLTYEKWDKMHHVFLHKSIIYTMVAMIIVIIFEATKALLTEISKEFMHISSLVVTIVAAVLISIFFEPIRKKSEQLINKIMIK